MYTFFELGAFLPVQYTTLDHHNGLLLTLGARNRERQGVSCPYFGLQFSQVLNVLRPNVTAMDDNHVLFASGDENTLPDLIGQISRIQPTVLRKDSQRAPGITKIAGHNAGAPEIQGAAMSLREYTPR